MDKKLLIEQAMSFDGCEGGMNQLKSCKTDDDIVQCYLDRIDFCLSNNFPNNEFMKEYSSVFEKFGVYVDKRWKLDDPRKLVLLGRCDMNVRVAGFSVSRIYAKHNTLLQIEASENSFVLVDALDNANVHVRTSGDAKVIVNLYASAECSGATKVCNKKRFTYEL